MAGVCMPVSILWAVCSHLNNINDPRRAPAMAEVKKIKAVCLGAKLTALYRVLSTKEESKRALIDTPTLCHYVQITCL